MNRIVAPAPADATHGGAADCAIRCLAPAGAAPADVSDAYLIDDPALDAGTIPAAAGIVLPREGAARAAALLAAGARRVFLGEAALLDSSILAALATRFGSERVGVYVPARRIEISWSFDTTSNADFKVLTPSLGAPAWEALRADGTPTGTQVLWWLGEMLKQDAAEALLCVDIRDDSDLNLCAECVEHFGNWIWVGPLADAEPALDEWIRYGHVRQLALPPALHARAIAIDAAVTATADAGSAPVERAA
jgi:hypothetical protein